MGQEAQAQGADTLEPGQEAAPNTEAQPNDEPGGQNEGADDGEPSNGEDSPYAPLAKEMGWVPRDQYSGPADGWKDPETFIRDGRDIQRETSRELKSVRQQLDAIAKTSASIVQQQVGERVAELTRAHAQAVEDGDQKAAFDIASQITTLKQQPAGPQAQPQASPEAEAFAERNASWFRKPGHEFATARAVEICNMLAGQGYTDHATQLRIAEQRLRQEMPDLFAAQKNGKAPAAVNAPGSRTAGRPSNQGKTFSDLPKAAQDIAIDLEARGVLKPEGDGKISAREVYAQKYFANLEAKG